ncbi:MAG: NAD(P)H-dependent glycerol-3-phosphate dehydrogenase [Bacteroidota bacterium]
MRIAILGAGGWGTTLAILLSDNKHKVSLWTYSEDQARAIRETRTNAQFLPGIVVPSQIEILTDIEQAVAQEDLVVAAVPSQFLRSVAKQVAQCDFRTKIVVNVAKGIENDTLMTMSEVLGDVLTRLRKENICTLSGPSFAEEVSRKIPTAVVAASASIPTAKIVQGVFTTPYFRVYVNEDTRGVELGGSLKNVIAIGAGISDGAGFGDNTKAAIMTRGIAEITRLGVAMGADPRTFVGLSGVGDLIVTCMSRHSRNRHVGEQVGKGRKLSDVLKDMVMVAEGVQTTESTRDLARKYSIEMPITNEVHNALFEGKDPHKATQDLMTRDVKGEV